MSTRHGRHLLVLALTAAGALALAPPATAQEECAACHEDVAKAFAKTGHGRRFAADKAYVSSNCASCHVGAQEHAASGGEMKPLNPAKGAAREANAACLACPESNPAQANWQGSAHQLAGNKCAGCHDVHDQHPGTPEMGKKLPGAAATTRKCLECHGSLRASLHRRSAHPLRDGQMDCTSCHDPHGTAGEKLLRQASTNDLCYSCHQNMRGPFLWEHSPVRQDCLRCHRAHGSALARDVVSHLNVLAEEREQSLVAEAVDPVLVRGDRLVLRQALVSLVDNAIKYSPEGTRVRVVTGAGPGGAFVEVPDEGPGIAEPHRQRVFERFYRIDRSRSREMGGVGLGLSLVKWGVEAHGGRVELESREGAGSTFRLMLPAS